MSVFASVEVPGTTDAEACLLTHRFVTLNLVLCGHNGENLHLVLYPVMVVYLFEYEFVFVKQALLKVSVV